MSNTDDILHRAKQCLSDYEWAKAKLCKVAVATERPHRIIAELVAEVERLRATERAVRDELTNITDDRVYERLAKAAGLS